MMVSFLGVKRNFGTKRDGSGTFDWSVVWFGVPVQETTRGKMNIAGSGMNVRQYNCIDKLDVVSLFSDIEVLDEVDIITQDDFDNPSAPAKFAGIR